MIDVLHEDDALLVVNKPAGLLAVPDRFDKQRPNLFDMLQAQRPGQWLANVHRLDFNTSGVFVSAKSREAFRQFRQRVIGKFYVALVQGAPSQSPLTIDLPLAAEYGRAWVDRGGREARTIVHLRERYRGYSLLQVEIQTGRTHQIRVHLRAVGCPVVGDADYGGTPLWLSKIKRGYKSTGVEKPLLDRPALHAERMELREPAQTFTAPWPKDLTVAVKYLWKYARQSSI